MANLAQHIGRTGMGVMGGREEASACGLSGEGGAWFECLGTPGPHSLVFILPLTC